MAGIYVHIPFCSQACYYCDFHFSTSLNTKTKIIQSIQNELFNEKKYLKDLLVKTIYFGGGTPSLLDADSIEVILKTIQKNFKLSNNIECTIEANPEDITEIKLQKSYKNIWKASKTILNPWESF